MTDDALSKAPMMKTVMMWTDDLGHLHNTEAEAAAANQLRSDRRMLVEVINPDWRNAMLRGERDDYTSARTSGAIRFLQEIDKRDPELGTRVRGLFKAD